jgi:dynactin 1
MEECGCGSYDDDDDDLTWQTIDYELRKLEAQQSAEIIDHLKSFIPNSFVISGGDYDALNVTMLLPRLSLKAELIMDQLKQQANVDSVLSNLNNAKHGPQTDFQTFVAYLCYKMSLFQNLVNVVMRILNECDVSLYKQVGSLRDDLTLHERVMDALIDLLKKEQLDESVPLNGIDKAINHFENLISNRLSFEPQSGAIDKFNDQVKVVTAACDYCSLEIIRLRHFAKEGSGFHAQLKELETFNSDVRQSCRRARRRLPSPRSGKIISCPPSLFPSVISQQSLLVEGFKSLYSQLHLRQQSLTDNEVLSSGELEHCLMELSKGLCQKFENIGLTLSDEQSIHLCLSKMAKNLEEFLNDLQNGVYDTEAPKIQVTSPLVARSLTVKAELSDTENLKYRVEEKNEEILELKKNLKLKVVEIGEINTKVELLGKKLELADEECVRKVEEQKLETERVKTVMDQMEEKFNKAIAILQKDMENLEEERETLKHQLETQSRTPIPADISGTRRSLSLSGRKSLSALMGRAQSLSVAPPSVSSSSSSEQAREEIPQFNSSPLLLAQVDSLRKALYYSQDENVRLKASAVKVINNNFTTCL